jgi:4'-phosphopantetheinyl transferase EntD
MISNILPCGVEAVEIVGDDPAARLLKPEESALGCVSEARRREFTTARSCAQRALAKLNLPPSPILPGPHREPRWPVGVVGSITHCPGYRAAAVAKNKDFLSIGIDAEVHEELPDGIVKRVALREEQAWLRLLQDTGICWDRVLFSAKESLYKTWFPVTGRWLGFEEVLVRVDPARGTFHAQLLVTNPIVDGRKIAGFDGRFCIRNGFVLTFVGLAAQAGHSQ